MENFLPPSPFIIAAATASIFLFAILFVLVFVSRSEIRNVKYKYYSLVDYLSDGDSKDLLQQCVNKIHELDFDSKIKEKDISGLFDTLSCCVQKVAIVRYNAFKDVGSDLSFSIALLDNDDNGVVISGLYGRETSTTYAKPIDLGRSPYILTDEEVQAISLARKKHIGKSYYGIRKKMEAIDVDE